MAKKDNEYRLCYVDDNIMYFSDSFAHQWGDDWNDRPYEHNAGEPYDLKDNEPLREGYGHIRMIAFKPSWSIKLPCDGHLNSPYSVEGINNGAIAWLYCDEAGGLMAGSTMDEAIAWCKRARVKWGELTE